jgi:hypothetical protein
MPEGHHRDCARRLAGAGLVSNFGTMAKPFRRAVGARGRHRGAPGRRRLHRVARCTGARWASLRLCRPGQCRPQLAAQAGRDWSILTQGLSVKKYPLCYCTHRAIDGALDLLRDQKIGPADVKAITVSTSRRNTKILRNSRPQTGLEAKFSMQFAMASAIAAKRVGLTELTDTFVLGKDIQALMPKVEVVPDDARTPPAGCLPYDRGDRDHGRPQARRARHLSGLAGAAAFAQSCGPSSRRFAVGNPSSRRAPSSTP